VSPLDATGSVAEAGWSVVDLLDETAVETARRLVDASDLDPDHGFFASPAMAWGPVARDLDERIKALVAPHAARVLPGRRPFMAAITSKGAGSTEVIPFHQDWTYTDERLARVTFLWCPLVDTDEGNGTLRVVPGSHRWSDDIRPSRGQEASLGLEAELAARSVAVPLRAGQALAFDPATFHGSGPNRTGRPRPALTIAFVEDGVQLLHFHESPGGEVGGFLVDDRFFTENAYRTRPEGYPTVAPHAPVLTEQTLAAAMVRERRAAV
jgi:hypothetical protein